MSLIKNYQKPFIKWVGGKTQIIDEIVKIIPTQMENYYEVFLGGGSVLLALLTLQKENKIKIKKNIYAYDLNSSLINVYKHIQNEKTNLFKKINKYKKEYDKIDGIIINRNPKTKKDALSSKESYYYWVRNKFNKMDKNKVEYSAIFIFLNKTGFRGLYREGPNGFNVPYGHYKTTPNIITKDELYKISDLIKDVKFMCSDFNDSLKNVKKGDFVYLDPPYAPEKENSFVSYTKQGFDLENHNKLFDLVEKMNKEKIKFAMSNAKVEIVEDKFPTNEYKILEIIVKRSINSKNPASKTKELIIYNL
jgi:DNA adenine methylase